DCVSLEFPPAGGPGRDSALLIRQPLPATRFVFLSRDGSDDARLAAVEAGASAYVLKSDPASDVLDAVRKAADGISMISPTAVARLVSKGRDRRPHAGQLEPSGTGGLAAHGRWRGDARDRQAARGQLYDGPHTHPVDWRQAGNAFPGQRRRHGAKPGAGPLGPSPESD